MPTQWLTQFTRIDAYDIDPLAQSLFNWRHGRALRHSNTQITHHRQDAMVHLPDVSELLALKSTLSGRDWGSVHDLLSGPTLIPQATDSRIQNVRQNVYPKDMDATYNQSLVQGLRAQGIWFDHLTSHVFADDTNTTLIPWEFKTNYWHWLQAGWQTPR